MVAHNRRLKTITLEVDGVDVECQVTSWKLNPPQNVVGDKVYTFCPDGEFREETDPEDWTLDLSWVSDWRVGGLNRLLLAESGNVLAFTLRHHPTTTGEAVEFTGSIYAQAPPIGGDARTTEMSEVTLLGVGTFPTPSYPVVP